MKRLTSIPWWAWAVVVFVPFGWAVLPYFIVKGSRMKFKGVADYTFKKGKPKDEPHKGNVGNHPDCCEPDPEPETRKATEVDPNV